MGKKCNFIFYNSTSFFDLVLWSTGSGCSADITPFWSSPCLPPWCYSIIQGPSSLRMLSGREEWSLVPMFPLESQSLGAPGLLMADLLLPGTTLRESSLHCPWFCFLETQHSHHLDTDHFSLLLGLLALFSLFLLPSLVCNPSLFTLWPLNPLLLAPGDWGWGFSWRVHLHPPEALDLYVNRMRRELVGKQKNTSKINSVLSWGLDVCVSFCESYSRSPCWWLFL